MARSLDATGSQFSTGFVATHNDGRRAFLKALDPTVDPTLEASEQLKDLETRLAIFNYECDLLEKCVVKRIRRVVRVIDRGACAAPNLSGSIHYTLALRANVGSRSRLP